MELDPSRAYTMANSFRAGGSLVLDPVDDIDSEALALGAITPAEPVRMRIQRRRKVGDLVMGPTPLDVVSARFVQLLERGGFTGWRTFPVEVVGPLTDELRDHRGFVVTGRSGPLDRARSERVSMPPHGPGLPEWPARRGLYPTDWDGSDVFTPTGTWHTCVTQGVRDAVTAARLVGVEFTRLTEWAVAVVEDED